MLYFFQNSGGVFELGRYSGSLLSRTAEILIRPSPLLPVKPKQLKYKEVETELRQLARTLPAGAKLPGERDMALEYKCNFLTVRKALKRLVEDGTIVRRTGSGTFIAESASAPPPEQSIRTESNRVGVLVFQKSNAYAFAVLQALARVAITDHVDLRSAWVQNYADDALRQAELLARQGCAAFTLPWFPLDMTDEVQSFVRRSPLPVSLPMLIPGLERFCFEEKHLFGSTILSGTEGLCRYFHLLGHERIAFLGPDAASDNILQQKLGAYSCFLSREGMQMLCGLVKSGSVAMDQLAGRWKEFRSKLAVISYDDEHALRFMTAMHKLGLSAPDDFAMIGYNNTDASHYSDPPLSSVSVSLDYVAHWLLRSALALAQGEVAQSARAMPLGLIVRSTCGGKGRIDGLMKELLLKFSLDAQLEEEVGGEEAGLAA